jgi:hypothetical protein
MYDYDICPSDGDTILALKGVRGTQPFLCKERLANMDAQPRVSDAEGKPLPKRARLASNTRCCPHAHSEQHFSVTFRVSGAILAQASFIFKAEMQKHATGPMHRQLKVDMKMCSAEAMAIVMRCLHFSPESFIPTNVNLHVLFEIARITEVFCLHSAMGLRLRNYIDHFVSNENTVELTSEVQLCWIFICKVANYDRMFHKAVWKVLGHWGGDQIDAPLPDIPGIDVIVSEYLGPFSP